jgi:hypothetical protein
MWIDGIIYAMWIAARESTCVTEWYNLLSAQLLENCILQHFTKDFPIVSNQAKKTQELLKNRLVWVRRIVFIFYFSVSPVFWVLEVKVFWSVLMGEITHRFIKTNGITLHIAEQGPSGMYTWISRASFDLTKTILSWWTRICFCLVTQESPGHLLISKNPLELMNKDMFLSGYTRSSRASFDFTKPSWADEQGYVFVWLHKYLQGIFWFHKTILSWWTRIFIWYTRIWQILWFDKMIKELLGYFFLFAVLLLFFCFGML